MLTRRENLLIRPWQERRYINHRIKVETALPVIDNNPPAFRNHVSYKVKKFQKEKERCCQIISDNFTLLQHLGYITRTTRVDNVWDEPPPNFLNRVGIYWGRRASKLSVSDVDEIMDEPKNRKDRCYGCSPHRYSQKALVPDERIPFEPPKKIISRKLQPASDTEGIKDADKVSSTSDKAVSPKKQDATKSNKARTRRRQQRLEPQSLLVSRGGLTLRLHIPMDSELVLKDKGNVKILKRNLCHCSAIISPKLNSGISSTPDNKVEKI